MNFKNLKTLFFENIGIKQTILKNTFWLVFSEGVSRLFKFFLVIYVARALGATEYGKFTFVFAFVSMFVVFSDLGLPQVIIREFAQNKEKDKEFSAIVSLKIILSLGALLLILIGSFLITQDILIQKLILILGLFAVIENFLEIIFSFFQAKQKMEYQAFVKIFEAIIITTIGFFVVFKIPSVQSLSYAYLFASSAVFIFILLFFHFKIYHLCFCFEKSVWQKFLVMSWPLALIIIFRAIYSQTDSIMMGYFGQITQAGWYNAAYKIINTTLIPFSLISIVFFPLLSKTFKESKESFQKIWNYFIESTIFLAIPMMVGGIVLAPKIIDFVYGQDYFPSIFVLQVLFVLLAAFSVFFPFSQVLIVAGKQRKFFLATFAGALINVILNLILIPTYSFYGAAVATLFTFLLMTLFLFRFVCEINFVNPFNSKFIFTLIGVIISSVAMCFIISQNKIYHLNILLSILVGTIVYLVCFFVYKKFINQFRHKFIKNV